MAAARDGSLQVAFGVGKYTNRNVFDGYAGVSRGKEQWTVRASRRLSDDPDRIGAGPIDYEVIEPYRRVRFALRRERHRADRVRMDLRSRRSAGARTSATGSTRPRREPDSTPRCCATTRSACLGMGRGRRRAHARSLRHLVHHPRPLVGRAPGRRSPADRHRAGARDSAPASSFRFSWSPMLLERPDGSATRSTISTAMTRRSATRSDGRRRRRAPRRHASNGSPALRPELRFDPANRRVLGGTLHFTMADGSDRPSPSRRSATPAFISAAASTSGSTATTTANGAARCTSTANTSPTAPTRRPPAGSTRSATRCCASTIRSAAATAGATSRPSSPAPGPTSASRARPPSSSHRSWPSCRPRTNRLADRRSRRAG